jgi:hypothetical protein
MISLVLGIVLSSLKPMICHALRFGMLMFPFLAYFAVEF